MKKENKKRIVSLALAGILSLSGGFSIEKDKSKRFLTFNPITTVEAKDNYDIYVSINSENIEFDVKPVMKNDRTFVPMRKIFEELDAKVEYDEVTDSINVKTLEKDNLTHKIGTNRIIKNENEILEFDVPSFIENDRTMVPARFVAEALGAEVHYYDDTYYKEAVVSIKKVIKEANGNTNIANKIINLINNNNNYSSEEKKFMIDNLTPIFNDLSKYLTSNKYLDLADATITYNDVETRPSGALGFVENGNIYFYWKNFKECDKNTFLHEVMHTIDINKGNACTEGMVDLVLNEYLDEYAQGYIGEMLISMIFIEVFGKDPVGYSTYDIFDIYNDWGYQDILNEEFKNKAETKISKKNGDAISYSSLLPKFKNEVIESKQQTQELAEEFIEKMTQIYERRTGEKASDNKLLMAYFDGLDFKNRLGLPTDIDGYGRPIYETSYRYFNNPSNDDDDIILCLGNRNSYMEYNIGPKYVNKKNKTLELSR